MQAASINGHIVTTPGTCGGRPRIAGRRITVEHIATWHEQLGMSVEEIASDYDLTLAEIHAALAYYFDHREEIDRTTRENDAFVEELRKRTPSTLEQGR